MSFSIPLDISNIKGNVRGASMQFEVATDNPELYKMISTNDAFNPFNRITITASDGTALYERDFEKESQDKAAELKKQWDEVEQMCDLNALCNKLQAVFKVLYDTNGYGDIGVRDMIIFANHIRTARGFVGCLKK